MDDVSTLEVALGADLLRADMLGSARPRIANRYCIERFLGRGATGLVVAALDETLDRRVALKLSLAHADASLGGEARALAQLDHPNVVRVFDATRSDATFDGTPFRLWVISMQLVDGVSMRSWLRERTRTTEEVIGVLRQAGAGLAAAHAQRIIHRDFKPENVLVRADGVVQVIDFGFAVPHRSSLRTPLADVAGTGPYLAPEARDGRVTPRSDQFAFGITLVEALTGDPTPPGRSPSRANIPPRLWRIARRATHARPEKRYPDMKALLADLDAVSSKPRRLIVSSFAPLLVLLAFFGFRHAYRSHVDSRCEALTGTWDFRTHVDETWNDGPPVGTQGLYTLTLTHRGECLFDVSLEHTGDDGPLGFHRYRREMQSPTPIRAEAGLYAPIRLDLERRVTLRSGRPFAIRYRLAFPDVRTLKGTFDATDYRGYIPWVSRSRAFLERDPRRLR